MKQHFFHFLAKEMNETWASLDFETESDRAWRQIADTESEKRNRRDNF